MGLDKRARGADQLGLRGRPEAGLVHERVDRLRKYRWSSYRAYVGLEPAPEWLDCGSVLELGGRGTVKERQRAYARYRNVVGKRARCQGSSFNTGVDGLVVLRQGLGMAGVLCRERAGAWYHVNG